MPRDARLVSDELAALGLDLESTLRDGPRFPLDGRLLGVLHAELLEQLGPDGARAALAQLGFLHGLRDAAAVLRNEAGGMLGESPAPMAPGLAIEFRPQAGSGPGPSLWLTGSWPGPGEARAVLETLERRDAGSCHASVGYTAGWLSGMLGADFLVVERRCEAAGDERCEFEAREISLWATESDTRVKAQRDCLPFATLRETVARYLEREELPEANRGEGFEPGTPVVHVWGPVMVLPFAGPDESLRALDLIGRDPGARQVRVVIVDISGTVIDEGFGSVALEQILDAIGGWGAEAILTGVSPLSVPVVAELERNRLVIHKDLAEAIAAAFQIAEAQRHAT